MEQGSLFFALNMEAGHAPSRIQLMPVGPEIVGRDGRRWLLDDPAAVVAATNTDMPQHVIDTNHATDLKGSRGEESPAMGWFSNVSLNESGEIWADVQWRDWGRSQVEGLAYRYISPVFEFDSERRITKIKRAALTNMPNLRLEALNNENPPMGREEKNMKEILAALGLKEAATEDEAVRAISTMKTALNAQQSSGGTEKGVDLTLYAPRADLQQMESRALNAEQKLQDIKESQLKEKAKTAVEKAITDRKIAPASKEEYLALCATESGLESFNKIIEKAPSIIPEGPQTPEGSPPAGQTALNAEEASVAKAAGYTKEEWKKLKEAAK